MWVFHCVQKQPYTISTCCQSHVDWLSNVWGDGVAVPCILKGKGDSNYWHVWMIEVCYFVCRENGFSATVSMVLCKMIDCMHYIAANIKGILSLLFITSPAGSQTLGMIQYPLEKKNPSTVKEEQRVCFLCIYECWNGKHIRLTCNFSPLSCNEPLVGCTSSLWLLQCGQNSPD